LKESISTKDQSNMKNLPQWAAKHRDKWEYKGQKRPSFALKPKKGQESVWDYPRPPILDPDNREVIVKWENIIIAKSSNTIRLLETASPPTFYIPPQDVNLDYLMKTDKTSRCEWKGKAIYWNVLMDGEKIINAAWSYQTPFDDYKEIAGYFCFYPKKVHCFVDDEEVRPQPGGFYGGWITDEIVGPMKGESNKTYL